MRYFRAWLVVCMMGWSSTLCYAERITLDFLCQEAVKENPEIRAAERAFKSASARIPQSLSLPDPVVEFEYDRLSQEDVMKKYAVSQAIPFPTKLYFRAKAQAALAKSAYEQYKAKKRSIVAQVKRAYAEYYVIEKSLAIIHEQQSVLEQFSRSATTRYGAGKGTQADALKAQVELARSENDRILWEQKKVSLQAELVMLINGSPDFVIGVPEPEAVIPQMDTLADVIARVSDTNPELMAYHYAIRKGKAWVGIAGSEFLPDLSVKVTQLYDNGSLQEDEWAGMVGVTIPLWGLQKQLFGVKEMTAELEAVEAEYRAKENEIIANVKDAYARYTANARMLELFETAFIPQAEQTLEAVRRGYESGTHDFLTLLDTQRTVTEFKMKRYEAIMALRIAAADIDQLVPRAHEEEDER